MTTTRPPPWPTELRPFFSLLLLLPLTSCAPARPMVKAVRAEPAIDAIVQPYIDAGYASAINVGLLRGGKRETRHFGTQGRVDDVFEIGSVTKVFTATLLADAVTRGTIKLDDDVSRCLPPDVKLPGAITFAQLSSHTSGLPRLGDMPMANPHDPYADFDAPKLYAALKTAALGPTSYAYSDLGVTLLGQALVECEHKTYGELIASVITMPLGMKMTGLDVPLGGEGHDFNGAPATPWKMPLPGAGGLRSNVDDLLRFVAAQLDPPPSLAAAIALTHQERAKRPGGAIALGWHLGLESMPDVLWHNGETGSFHAFIAFDPAHALGVVLLANEALPSFDAAGIALLHNLRGEPRPLPVTRVIISDDKLTRLAGRYNLGSGQLAVEKRGTQLWVQLTGQDAFRTWPVADNVFEVPLVGARLEFASDGSEVKLVQNGATQRALRAKP